MNKKTLLKLSWEENWQTRAGAWFPGERIILHGEDVMDAMQGKTWMEMILLASTGKIPNQKQAKLLDEVLAFIGCYPDPRLWNNRIAALAGTARSTSSLATSAGTVASEAIIYGFQPALGALRMYRDIVRRLNQNEDLREILASLLEQRTGREGRPDKGKKRDISCIPGFGRPTNKKDERIAPIMATLKKYDASNGDVVQLAFNIEATLSNMGYKLVLNAAGLIAAICLDQKIGDQEFLHYGTCGFYPGLMACFDDAVKHPEGSFFPIRCEQIEYTGAAKRQWQTLA